MKTETLECLVCPVSVYYGTVLVSPNFSLFEMCGLFRANKLSWRHRIRSFLTYAYLFEFSVPRPHDQNDSRVSVNDDQHGQVERPQS